MAVLWLADARAVRERERERVACGWVGKKRGSSGPGRPGTDSGRLTHTHEREYLKGGGGRS